MLLQKKCKVKTYIKKQGTSSELKKMDATAH